MLIPLSTNQPLYRQIYDALRKRIIAGELQPGDKLLSTREMADQLAISRTSVLEAYEQLISEGYIETRRGSGTYISAQLPSENTQTATQKKHAAHHRNRRSYKLSDAAKQVNRHLPQVFFSPPPATIPNIQYNFQAGRAQIDSRSEMEWRKLVNRSSQKALLEPPPNQGNMELRTAIANHLKQTRHCQCDTSNIVITNGSQQAFDILSKLLINPGDTVAVEEPGYFGAKAAFAAHHAKITYVKTDSQGMIISELEKKSDEIRLAYVTPSHQFPRGSVLPRERRIALLEWAKREKAYILEDDYDSEYRYDGRPLESIHSIDNTQSTLYIGTFSKVFSPSLRLGYVVLPQELVAPFIRLRWATDVQTPALQQIALAQWLTEGHHQRHLRRMQRIYSQRRNVLVESLHQYFSPQDIEIEGANTGLHIFAHFKQLTSQHQQVLNDSLRTRGIAATTPDFYYHRLPKTCSLVLGFSLIDEALIPTGIKQLSKAIQALRKIS